MSVEHGEQRGEVGAVMGGAVTARPCLFLWGGADQLVPLCCWSNKEPCAHMALTNCGVARVHLYELRSHISANTHALSAGPLTSVYDSPVVVEDYSALVQGRDCVQQVEGAQIPLRLQLRKIPLSYSDNLNLS